MGSTGEVVSSLEEVVRHLTIPINGQYPRPWMTDMQDPSDAQVFIVGYNPAKAYRVESITHERHIDALFNRNGETCRGLYCEIAEVSPTRGNIQMFTAKLASVGVSSVLETNVICYATGSKKDLNRLEHTGGKARGLMIFSTILREISPKVVIIHGAGVREEFNRSFRYETELPRPPATPTTFAEATLSTGTHVYVIPSLALPGYQNWPPGNSFCNWADSYLSALACKIAAECAA